MINALNSTRVDTKHSEVTATDNVIKWVNPLSLKEHPFSLTIYGSDRHDDLVESIREYSVLTPLVICGDQVISGHRRLRAALELGIDLVPCVEKKLSSILEEKEVILEYNRYRIKNASQLYREGKAIEQIIREKTHQMQVRGGVKKVRQNFAVPKDKLRTRARIAQAIGIGSGEQWRKLEFIGKHSPDILDRIKSTDLSIHKAYSLSKERVSDESSKHVATIRSFKSATIKFGSFTQAFGDIPDNSVDLVITNLHPDPEVWEPFSLSSSRVVVAGGFVIVFLLDKQSVPDALSAITQHLRYFWIMSFILNGPQSRLTQPQNVLSNWVPIIILSNGKPRFKPTKMWSDSQIERWQGQCHRWLYLPAARYLIRLFSPPRSTILDPFALGGEFLFAASLEGRFARGYESNTYYYQRAIRLLSQTEDETLAQCPRKCGGRLFREDNEVYCLQCGYRADYVGPDIVNHEHK